MTKIQQAVNHLANKNGFGQFIGKRQKNVLAGFLRNSEEKEFFADKIIELANVVATMAKTYEQDGKGDDTIIYLHYFVSNADCYITEKDMEDNVSQAYGTVSWDGGGSGDDGKGYISITEWIENGAELDLHWKPISAANWRKQLLKPAN